mgnify:CR=1 FL=1
MSKIYFHEKQRFNQWWLWLLLLIIGYFIFEPIYFSLSEGKTLSVDQWIGFLILTLIILLFLLVKLETKIQDNGIYVRFFPFIPKFKFYPWGNISIAVVRKYSPLMEYGGWGVRWGGNGTAYNVKGNKGLQLKFKSGNALLVGTQKPDELQKVLDELKP